MVYTLISTLKKYPLTSEWILTKPNIKREKFGFLDAYLMSIKSNQKDFGYPKTA